MFPRALGSCCVATCLGTGCGYPRPVCSACEEPDPGVKLPDFVNSWYPRGLCRQDFFSLVRNIPARWVIPGYPRAGWSLRVDVNAEGNPPTDGGRGQPSHSLAHGGDRPIAFRRLDQELRTGATTEPEQRRWA